MADVVNLNPSAPLNAGDPDPLIIERLEVALEQAKRGEIVAIGIAVARPNGTSGSAYAYPGAMVSGGDATAGYHQLVSAVASLAFRLQNH